MRGLYVHAASLRMEPGADPAAPGAAITLELCGTGRWSVLGTKAGVLSGAEHAQRIAMT